MEKCVNCGEEQEKHKWVAIVKDGYLSGEKALVCPHAGADGKIRAWLGGTGEDMPTTPSGFTKEEADSILQAELRVEAQQKQQAEEERKKTKEGIEREAKLVLIADLEQHIEDIEAGSEGDFNKEDLESWIRNKKEELEADK